jgi:hypothetical protein
MATWIDPDRRCLELRLARAEVRRSADEPIDRTGRGSHSLAPVPPRRRREGFGRLSRAASSSATWCSPCCAKSTARGCTLRATSSFNSKDLRCCEDKCEDVFEFLEHGGRRARRSRRSKRVLRSENENRAMLGRVALRFPTSPSRRLPHEPRHCRARGTVADSACFRERAAAGQFFPAGKGGNRMRRTIFTAASVVALMLGTAMAQTSTSPSATGGARDTMDRSMDCDSGSPTAKAPGTAGSAGSTTSQNKTSTPAPSSTSPSAPSPSGTSR